MSTFDYDRVKDLPPGPDEGAHSLDEMWASLTYFVKAVMPVAEESNVRMALHPNDRPPPISRGSGQPMGSLEGWTRLIDIVPSKSNGITFDFGVTRELGEDPVEVCRYFGSRDRINHCISATCVRGPPTHRRRSSLRLRRRTLRGSCPDRS